MIKTDEKRIQHKLSGYLLGKGHDVVIPNVSWSWLYWEADLISVTKAGYMYEFEIKITRSDFEADFRKRKHQDLKRGAKNIRIPNYFSYVAPLVAMPLCVPDYAGLYEVRKSGWYDHELELVTIRKPALIHRAKHDNDTKVKMLKTLMFKYWDLTHKLDNLKIQKGLFQK